MFRRLQLLILAAILVIAAFSTGLDVPVLPRVPRRPRDRRLVRPDAARARGPRGRLRGQPAVRPRRRPDPGHVHAAEHEPAPQAVAGDPQPDLAPGRACPGGRSRSAGRTERSWLIRTPLTRRGHFRIEPLQIRTGDPFGFFESSASVGSGINVTVYPRLEPVPLWRLPASNLDGSHAMRERTLQATPLATTVRPWAPGDAFNRIHWKSTARHGDIQVKEFDLEQTADAWVLLDLERGIQRGHGRRVDRRGRGPRGRRRRGQGARREPGRRHDASTRTASRSSSRTAAGAQHLKVMQLLAAVEGDGATPVRGGADRERAADPAGHDRDRDHRLARPRLGEAAGDASVSRRRVRRGLARHPAFERHELDRRRSAPARRQARHAAAGAGRAREASPAAQQWRALRHALAEFDIARLRGRARRRRSRRRSPRDRRRTRPTLRQAARSAELDRGHARSARRRAG